ncbi:hypothetical protein D9M72_576320 [compost metagenome]
MGSRAFASTRSASFTVRFAPYSWSISSLAAWREVKNTSWAARKRAQSASSSLRLARGEAFHSSIRRRYSPAAKPQSVEVDSASASAISFSFAALAAELLLSSWEK